MVTNLRIGFKPKKKYFSIKYIYLDLSNEKKIYVLGIKKYLGRKF